ncbi:MAG: TerC family protein [Proteobacteria bacterium]|nr:TerC family protein [Pseudomonadota bacterium]
MIGFNELVALLTLTAIEIVLGIDNIIFISILSGKLPQEQQNKARFIGLSLAMITRILFLFSITFIMGLTKPIFTVLNKPFSGREIILFAGGLFLLAKSTTEIHDKLEGAEKRDIKRFTSTFISVIVQIILLDIVFSLDSIITAIGLTQNIKIMVIAIIFATIFMMIFSASIYKFIERHPTMKILALAFLILVGVALIGDSLGMHIPRGYIYFAMAFSFGVEMINLRIRPLSKEPVKLHMPYSDKTIDN